MDPLSLAIGIAIGFACVVSFLKIRQRVKRKREALDDRFKWLDQRMEHRDDQFWKLYHRIDALEAEAKAKDK